MPHQSFIVVRPPPSKTNHPLNLQVQLLPPKNKDANRSTASHRGRSSDCSIAAVDDDGTADGLLTLPDANHSAISMYSSSSSYSTASLASVASTSSVSAGGRRAIVPLYNLQAHSVLASTIVDARTDAKVAKFHKRGLELVGLATLEPVEVWGGDGSGRCPPPNALASDKSTLTLADTTGSARACESAEPALGAPSETASSLSALSHTSAELSVTPASGPLSTPLPLTSFAVPETPTSPSGTKRFLGKLFKRPVSEPRAAANADPHPYPPGPLLVPSITASAHPLQHASAPLLTAAILTAAIGGGSPSPVASGCRSSESSLSVATVIPPAQWGLPSPPSSEPRSSTSTSARESASAATSQRPCVLGVQPAISARAQPPRGRPTKYVWTVRKWHKRGAQADGSLSGTKEKSRARDAASASCAVESLVEVRFEWTRGDKRRRSGSRKDKREDDAEQATDVDSGVVPPGASPVSTTDCDLEGHSPDEEDAEEDSEPEDSETPWTCTLILRRRYASRSAAGPLHSPSSSTTSHGSGGGGTSPNQAQPRSEPTLAATAHGPSAFATGSNPSTVRVKVARMVPTPHHPKIVALFKAPFPLPDVDVARVDVRKRTVEAAPVSTPMIPAASVDSRPGTSRGRGTSGSTGRKGLFGGSKSETQFSVADAELGFARRGPGPVEPDSDGTGLVLTAEEIKDVVASTALWLVVREGFGGVGRVSRKGDRSWGVR